MTAQGKVMLIDWIAEPSSPTAIMEELLVKVLAAHLTSTTTIVEEIQRRQKLHQEKLSAYLAAEAEKFANLAQLPLEKKCMYLTLRREIRLETQWVEWCKEAIAILQSKLAEN